MKRPAFSAGAQGGRILAALRKKDKGFTCRPCRRKACFCLGAAPPRRTHHGHHGVQIILCSGATTWCPLAPARCCSHRPDCPLLPFSPPFLSRNLAATLHKLTVGSLDPTCAPNTRALVSSSSANNTLVASARRSAADVHPGPSPEPKRHCRGSVHFVSSWPGARFSPRRTSPGSSFRFLPFPTHGDLGDL